MKKHFYFVRHGETDTNADGILRGPESMLSEKGIMQANVVAGRIKRIGVDAIVASTYQRTLDTASAISKATGVPIEPSELLIEWIQPSGVSNRHREDPAVREIHQRVNDGYATGERHSDEEPFDALKERAIGALSLLEKHPAERICVVTHGVFMRMLIGAMIYGPDLTGPDYQRLMNRFITSNTGITYARYGDRTGFHNLAAGWEIITWNDSAHLG